MSEAYEFTHTDNYMPLYYIHQCYILTFEFIINRAVTLAQRASLSPHM